MGPSLDLYGVDSWNGTEFGFVRGRVLDLYGAHSLICMGPSLDLYGAESTKWEIFFCGIFCAKLLGKTKRMRK